MSLLVSVYRKKASGDMEDVELQPGPGGEPSLFGGEQCRTTLWGAPFTRALGLALLPSLAERDIYATGEDLRLLRREAELLLRRRAELARATGYDEDYIEFRLQNLLRAIAQAEAIEGEAGWVYVW
ncbi:hypothetical protein JQX13_21595 [Archangium violaceum]|uniref:hypothetical protein n=1 Tax=Archangium violaceum TaxID=83451 RepID=UPI00193B1C16|nr:hypothetical protein [Archangium violaceum]QRK12387.1 hypothetical protein JQX13_21595 [Archangium violaceum]